MTSAKMRILPAYMRSRIVARPEVVCAWGFGFSFGGSLPVGAGLWPFKFHHNEVSKFRGAGLPKFLEKFLYPEGCLK